MCLSSEKSTVYGSNIFLTDIVAFSTTSSEVISVLGTFKNCLVKLLTFVKTCTFLERFCIDTQRIFSPICPVLEKGLSHFTMDSTFLLSATFAVC